jgi:sugar lactone lactonase YvrE
VSLSPVTASPVSEGWDILGESPVWSEDEQALYWVDIRGRAVRRLDPDGRTVSTRSMPDLCCGVALGEGALIVALGRQLGRFWWANQSFEPLMAFEPDRPLNRLNEIKCDRRGRIWVGSMRDFAVETAGALYRISAGVPAALISEVRIPNSLGWSPNGDVLYFADTADGRIRAYDFDADAGAIGPARTFFDEARAPGGPDGCAVDAAGGLWSARHGGGCVVRIAPDAEITDRVDLPRGVQPTACALGGADLRTLYITTTRQGMTAEQIEAAPAAGRLFAATVSRPGLAEPVAAWPVGEVG